MNNNRIVINIYPISNIGEGKIKYAISIGFRSKDKFERQYGLCSDADYTEIMMEIRDTLRSILPDDVFEDRTNELMQKASKTANTIASLINKRNKSQCPDFTEEKWTNK